MAKIRFTIYTAANHGGKPHKSKTNGRFTNLPERVGTVGGALLVVIVQITCSEVVKTAVMAAVGAAVSFGLSWVLQQWARSKRP